MARLHPARPTRRATAALLGVGLLSIVVAPAAAQERFPSRPIDVIVTWGTGGGADAMARQLATLSQPHLTVPLPVSNVPDAAGNTGPAQVLTGKPDGYTVATYIQDTLMTIPMGLARHKVDDLVWISRTQGADSFLFVKSDAWFRTMPPPPARGQPRRSA